MKTRRRKTTKVKRRKEPTAARRRASSTVNLQRQSVESSRVALYGDEAGLEEKFIQPVFEKSLAGF